MPAYEFVRRMRIQADEPDRHYTFWLGAGCSVTSGIPAAASLVRDQWLPRLHHLQGEHGSSLEVWAKRTFRAYDAQNLAALYGPVMERLFKTKDDKQRETERLCEKGDPGFGYAILAALMSRSDGVFSAALTTNFDDLIADSMYVFGEHRPLVIQHNALAGFMRPGRVRRPLVVKVHGDHRLNPMHTSEETAELDAGVRNGVQGLLQDRGVIFIGYAGNDHGVVTALEALPDSAMPLGAWWVSRREPTGAIRGWLEARDATWIEAGGFDELMLLFREEFQIDHPTATKFERMVARYRETYEDLSARVADLPESAPDSGALKDADRGARESAAEWWRVELEARQHVRDDPDEAERIYVEGLQRIEDPRLIGSYANFLKNVRKDYEGAEEQYKKAIEVDPENAINLGNYANFLKEVRKDYEAAEEHYKRAIEADPENANNLGNYANFLKEVRKDYEAAEEHYKRAIEADPENANNLGNYAIYLKNVRRDYDAAEEYYKRAIEIDPANANNLGSYAILLKDVRKDYEAAEEYYKRAIEIDPENAINLGNYAIFLKGTRKDYEAAEEHYKRAIEADPENANNLGSYAILLKDVRKDYEAAEEQYKKAIEVDPENAINLGNYAIFLKEVRKDYEASEEQYKRAIEADPENAINLGNYANFLKNVRKDYEAAEEQYKRAIEADPENAINLGNYAIFLKGTRKDYEAAEEQYKRAIEVDPENAINLGSYAIFLKDVRKDYEAAEEQYKRAIEVDPENAINLGNYAIFLKDVRKNYEAAEEYYKRAIELDPENANNLGNYAQLLFEQDEILAWDLLDRALKTATEDPLLLEIAFYELALGDDERAESALPRIVELIDSGARSPGWNFDGIVASARRKERADIEWLELLADVISKEADPAQLDEWSKWREAS